MLRRSPSCLTFFRLRRYIPSFLPTDCNPRRSSFSISGYEATASFDSLVNGTQTLAMCTISVMGPEGSEPRDWLRP